MLQSPIVFRLPGSSQIQAFNTDKLGDRFIIHPFDRQEEAIQLTGFAESIDRAQARAIITEWQLPDRLFKEGQTVSYKQLVEQGMKEIQSGNIDKVVLARQKVVFSVTQPAEVFANLEEKYPDAFVYAFCINGKAMLGASPETLLSLENGLLKTEALGGTRTHGVYTEKEYQEHQQIVDYITQGIDQMGYSCQIMPTQERVAGSVEHLRSEIRVESKGIHSDLELLEVLHPTSAVCGVPYEASVNFIKNNEGFDRAFYAGYLGIISNEMSFKFYVNLRCASLFKGGYLLSAGAGINHLSIPEDEMEETNNKFQTIAQCLK